MTATAVRTAAYTPDVDAPASDRSPSLGRRFAERFALIAFGLYHLPLFINNYPSLGGGGFNDTGLAVTWGRVFTTPVVWIAQHVLHMGNVSPQWYSGDNGDTGEEYVRLLLAVVIGAIVAAAWVLKDRHRPKGQWVESTLRVMLRYSIVLGLLSYGIAKIYPQQFPPIPTPALDTRVGDLSPMSLLWTFMEYSRPYAFFGGLMELVAVAFLCFRRTATLGALLCLAVMTNVALLNYAYGVPVKLYATMITVSAAVLVLYDTRRLFDFFVRNRAVAEDRSSAWLQDHVPAVWRRAIKVVGVGSVTLSSMIAMAPTLHRDEPTGVVGNWNVSGAVNGWRRISVGPTGIAFRVSADSAIRCGRKPGPDMTNMSLQCIRGPAAQLRLTTVQDTLHIDGTFGNAPLHVTATRVSRSSYNLMRRKFRWIME